jgi:hypothetical protein
MTTESPPKLQPRLRESVSVPDKTGAVVISATKQRMIIQCTMSASFAVSHLTGRGVQQDRVWDWIPAVGESWRPSRRGA